VVNRQQEENNHQIPTNNKTTTAPLIEDRSHLKDQQQQGEGRLIEEKGGLTLSKTVGLDKTTDKQ
jgi:hypothetical protein